MIRKITKGQKETMITPNGGYGKSIARDSGILVVPDDNDFYGVLITDAMLLDLGYQPIPLDVEQAEGSEDVVDADNVKSDVVPE
jgi:hypothetical protein